jgi:DNA-binding NtrC family response regulator
MTSNIPLSRRGSALVVLDDERAVLAATLVLQEMGLTVDVANDREAALDWIVRAHYALVVCGGREQEQITRFVISVRYEAPHTRVILLAEPELVHDSLEELGIEVLQAPVNVNTLVQRLWPSVA